MKHTKLSSNGLFRGLFCLLALGVSATASAHLPYVLPFQFHTDQDVATLYAGSADRYFEPEIPGGGAEGGYDFTVTNPVGETGHVEFISRHKQLTLIKIDTREAGTYKVERTLVSADLPHVLRDGESVRVLSGISPERRKEFEAMKTEDGKRRFLFEDEVKPTEITGVRFINHITAYVTRDKANDAALKTSGKGFEFDFKVHPNEVSVQSGFKFVARVDGKAAAGIRFKVYKEGDSRPVQTVQSDRAGLVNLSFEQAGVYVLNAGAPLKSVRDGKIVNPRYLNWLVVEVRP